MHSSYLLNRNGHYHLRVRTPSDLLGIFPQTEIKKTLKTTSLKTARVSALPLLNGIRQTVALLRSRFITPEQAQDSLYSLLEYKPGVALRVLEKGSQEADIEAVSLSGVMKTYISDKESGWTLKTKMEAEGVFNIIRDLMGDVPVGSIDRNKVRDFRKQLVKLPPNVYKVYPKHSPLEVLEMIDKGKLKAEPMSSTSVNKHLARLSSLMIYSIKEGHRKDNPATDMTIKQKRRQDEERKAYDSQDIQMIVKNLPRDPQKPERFYIPMICMLSGMRLDEACQLHAEDIRQVDGIWCIDVNDSKDKKLKNISSNRLIPIHPKLIELGFLGHVTQISNAGASRLWMNLQRRDADGYGNALGQWFRRFNRQHITDDPQKTFHSLRHSFADTLKQLQVEGSIISELMGHANASITTGRYGKRYQPKVLLEVVQKVDYGAIAE